MALADFIIPFASIAKSLARIAELYELDLSSRNPPVLRVSERPKRGDTEVFYPDSKPASPFDHAVEEMLWEDEESERERG